MEMCNKNSKQAASEKHLANLLTSSKSKLFYPRNFVASKVFIWLY